MQLGLSHNLASRPIARHPLALLQLPWTLSTLEAAHFPRQRQAYQRASLPPSRHNTHSCPPRRGYLCALPFRPKLPPSCNH